MSYKTQYTLSVNNTGHSLHDSHKTKNSMVIGNPPRCTTDARLVAANCHKPIAMHSREKCASVDLVPN